VNDLKNNRAKLVRRGILEPAAAVFAGLSLLANYTFAKNLSNAPEFRSPMAESAIPQNDNDLAAEKGRPATCAIASR